MTQAEAFVGIDVAKHELVCHLHPEGIGWREANTPAGRKALVRRLTKLAQVHVLRIGYEASGGYERKLAMLIEEAGLAGYLLDPSRVRSYGRAEGMRAKTDPLDAALIARALAALHHDLAPWRRDPAAERLAERVRMRDLALAQAQQMICQLETLADPAMRRLVTGQLVRLKALVQRIEKTIAEQIAASPILARREALLRSAPGVGPVVAASLMAHMPELGSLTGRQAASLAGLAPFDRQSGATRKPGHCHSGRAQIRRVLYLAALSLQRPGNKTSLAAFAKRLKDNGKPPKVAIIATSRKLAVALNAMLKNDAFWGAA